MLIKFRKIIDDKLAYQSSNFIYRVQIYLIIYDKSEWYDD